MPLPGGESDKLGNNYEAWWTVRNMLRILHEKAESIELEPLGREGTGVEFILTLDNEVQEYHQVKRQHAKGWSVATLATSGVLSNFRDRLYQRPKSICVFVTQDGPSKLRDLWEGACYDITLAQYEEHYLKAVDSKKEFDLLKKHWEDCSNDEARGLLRRLRLDGGPQSTLKDDVLFWAESLVEGSPELVAATLWQLSLSSFHTKIDATTIWKYLENPVRSFTRRVLFNDTHRLQEIKQVNDNYRIPLVSQNILGVAIPRLETKAIFARLQETNGNRIVLVSGAAGSGKTGVVVQVAELAETEGWLTLSFRLDRLEPPYLNAKQLGQQLGLSESPVTILGGVAGSRNCLLIIDQLDAVSISSDRHPALIERVDELLRQAKQFPNLRILLACRQFDLQNDDRLRRLLNSKSSEAEVISVTDLDTNEVKGILEQCSIEHKRLSESQIKFLATPIYLKLFVDLNGEFSFKSLKDLYDKFWRIKRDVIQKRVGNDRCWNQVIDWILEKMTTHQSLSVSSILADDKYPGEVNMMLTEGVLIQDSGRISFFHETFFDYSYARRFVAEERSLLDFLLANEQHLFLRSLVRQVLTHERDGNFEQYIENLNEMLSKDSIRFHIKRLIFQWLRSLPEPDEREWKIIETLRISEDENLVRWSKSVINGPGWFILLNNIGWVKTQLAHKDHELIKETVQYLRSLASDFPDVIAGLLKEWVDQPEPWPTYATQVLQTADLDKDRRLVDVYLTLRENGHMPLSEPPFGGFGRYMFYDLPEKRPHWATDIMREWLISHINDRYSEGQLNPFLDNSNQFRRYLNGVDDRLDHMARNDPIYFVDEILDIILELVRRNAQRKGLKPWKDSIWRYNHHHHHRDLHEQLLETTVTGLCILAVSQPDEFRRHEKILKQYIEFQTPIWMLARAYAANGATFANDAAEFLLADEQRLYLGWADSPSWVSRKLIGACTPFCSQDLYSKLETMVLNYYSIWERLHPRSLGYTQLSLLNAFSRERQSPLVKSRLGELRRKFAMTDQEPPQGIVGGWVGPPFEAKWEKMNDAQWALALTKYSSYVPRVESHDFTRGGAEELARVLQRQTAINPTRFALLLLTFAEDVKPVFIDAILRGIGDVPESSSPSLDPELLWDVLRACHVKSYMPHGMAISWALRGYIDADIPDDILNLIAWYAIQDQDPSGDDPQTVEDPEENSLNDSDIKGMNSVRGAMAWPISKILFNRVDYYPFFATVLEQMVVDSATPVRTQVALALIPVLNIDRDAAVRLFTKLCESAHPSLYAARAVERFLIHSIWTHFDSVYPIVLTMLDSDDPQIITHGAHIACLSAYANSRGKQLLDRCLEGNMPMRKAAAEIAAGRLQVADDKTLSEYILIKLFNDPDKEVRFSAANCFEGMEGGDIGVFEVVIKNYIESIAFDDDNYMFFNALDKATVPLPDITCLAFERYLEALRKISEEDLFARYADSKAHIVVRLYERTTDKDIKRRCLDIVDSLSRLDAVINLDRSLAAREL